MHFLWSTLLILALSSPASSIWIDVPFVQQQEEGCGAASLSMLIQYWKSKGHSVDQTASDPVRIMQLLYSKKDHGIPARDFTNYLRKNGFKAFEFTARWEDLAHHISKGRPLIAALEATGNRYRLHYLLVTGIDAHQNLVLVNDPAERKLLKMKRSNFEDRWKASGNWTLLAVPEQ
jgi:ABC-type bacteriocin/lantibiotic exporters, contain an N-terminal double-glycine peptidase domain